MEYSVGCECGRRLVVDSTAAGSVIPCECGWDVIVPPLSQLRATTGVGAYESGVLDTIQRMIRDGSLPWGETCAVSGWPTDGVLDLVVHCERVHLPRPNSKLMILFAPLFPALVLQAMSDEGREPVGRETSVTVPLRVAPEFHRRLARKWSPGKLKRLLKTVPIYATLLDQYPEATIEVRGEGDEVTENPGEI